MERNKKKQEWTPQVSSPLYKETELLTRLYPEFSSKKWKRIAEEFLLRGFNRSQIDCREKWINFLDPSINKNQWEEWQLQRLYDLHEEVGTRWCLIQKEIGRTQNKIKNRFYGTLRNFIRFVMNYFDTSRTCYNYQISKLSPKFLNNLYSSTNIFAFMAGETQRAIYSMKFIVDKKLLAQRIREHRPLYSRMQQMVFEAFEKLPRASTQRQTQQENGEISLEGAKSIEEPEIRIKKEDSTMGLSPQMVIPFKGEVMGQPPIFFQLMQYMQIQQPNQNIIYWYV